MPRKPLRRRSRKNASGRADTQNSSSQRRNARRRLLLECLEPRVVLSGSPLTGLPLAGGEGEGRDKSNCHFRETATGYDRKHSMNWLSISDLNVGLEQ